MTALSAAAWLLLLTTISVTAAVITAPPPDEENPVNNDRPFDGPTGPIVQPDLTERPRPVRDAAKSATAVVGTLTGVITVAGTVGLLSTAQADALTIVLGALLGLVTAGTTAWSAFRTANNSEYRVTPIGDPMKVVNGVLTELVPARRNAP